jgi:hypothetical protein
VLLCIKIEFASGTRYFSSSWEPSDVPAGQLYKLVADWGDINSLLGENTTFPQSLGGITINDPDGSIRELWEDESFQRVACDVYWAIWTPGQAIPGIAQATSILRGAIAPPESWAELDLTVSVGITDYSIRRQNVIGLRCTKDDYPNITVEDDGRIVPIVYGRPRAFQGIYINGGPIARLTDWVSLIETTFYVDDASGFPTGPITIAIGKEHITGSFDGNEFTVTQRGKVLLSGETTDHATLKATAIDNNRIGDGDNKYVGYKWRPSVYIDDGAVSRITQFSTIIALTTPMEQILDEISRDILRFESSTGTYEFNRPFVLETEIGYLSGGIVADTPIQTAGFECAIKKGVPYQVRTLAAEHNEGEEVRLVNEPAEFLVARGDRSGDIREVYVHGRRKPPWLVFAFRVNGLFGSITDLAQEVVRENTPVEVENAWVPLPKEMYEVDTTTHPGTGDTITRIKVRRRPTELPGYILDQDGILVDFNNSTQNPADIIEDICNTYGGMSVDFSSVAAQLTNWRMDFWDDSETSVYDLIADLAYQSRCALRWTKQDPELIYQGANGGTPVVSLTRAHIMTNLEGDSTFAMTRDDIDNVYSQITVNWREQGKLIGEMKEQSHTERDATVEGTVGRRDMQVNCWAYNEDAGPKALAKYMLERHKHLYRMITTDVSIYGIAIEPGDIVEVTHPVLPSTPEPGQVVSATHKPGRNPETGDAVGIVLRQFHWPGCGSTSCQGYCETTDCENVCQTGWQPAACWKCQTSCQTRCQLIACVTAGQSFCANTPCQTSCTTGCEAFCMPSTMNVGCGHCESVSCETTDCQTTDCQTLDCQTLDCQTLDCQTLDCQTLDCQTMDCQTLDCQTLDCQTLDCQTLDCQTMDCQTTECQTLDCQTLDCQTTDCQTMNCQTMDCQTTDCQTTDCQMSGCQAAGQTF